MARFLTLIDVTEILNISMSQASSLVRSGDLRAIQVGGRHQWRVERTELENYLKRMYAATDERIQKGRQVTWTHSGAPGNTSASITLSARPSGGGIMPTTTCPFS